jgi:error-prone DNA polymerase
MRLGLRMVRGLSEQKVRGIEAARRDAPITSIHALAHRPGVARETLLRLAAADAFCSLGLDRRQALWEILALRDGEPTLYDRLDPDEPRPVLPPCDLQEQIVQDYDAIGLSLTAHPISLVRGELAAIGVSPNEVLAGLPQGRRVAVSGLVLVRQRPGTAKGVVFMTLEDETGVANLIIRPRVWERWRRAARGSAAVVAEGTIERQGAVVHVMAARITGLSERIEQFGSQSRDFH